MTDLLGNSNCGKWFLKSESRTLLHLLDEIDERLCGRILDRMEGTSVNSREECERKLANCLSYLLARASLPDPSADLVANLGPDEAWHVFIHFTKEYTAFCHRHAGEYLHHDPAGETALVNVQRETERTVSVFEEHGIPYDPDLWRDHETFPLGATVIKTGVRPRQAV
jgi:hypothetical protein